MKHNIECLLFDLDGTLMDTASDFVTAIHQMQKDDNRPLLDSTIIRNNVSTGSYRLMELAYQLEQGSTELKHQRSRFLDYYNQLIKQPDRNNPASLYPGISELLNELDQKQIPWGIVTNKPEPYALILLEQHDLIDRSQTIICPEHVTKTKPSPEALLLACKHIQCSPETSIYIGDHERDIVAGKQANMFTITAHYGYLTDNDHPYSWQADHNIHSAAELSPWLNHNSWRIPGVDHDV